MIRKRCIHCKAKLPEGARLKIHEECIAPYADAMQAKSERKQAKAVKAAQMQDRRETKKKLEKLKTIAQLKDDVQRLMNRWVVNVRDKDRPCISCQRHHQGAYHAGHFRSRGSAPQHALNPLNVWKQCAPCNLYLHGNLIAYRQNLIAEIGLENVESLETDNAPKKWTRDELLDLAAMYKLKLKEEKCK